MLSRVLSWVGWGVVWGGETRMANNRILPRWFGLAVLGIAAALVPGASAAYGQSTMYCASDDMRRHYCSADTRGGVQMMRQRSDASCIQGRTWGYDRRGIWVDRGCRADFALNSGYRNRSGGYGGGPFGGYGNGGYGNRGYGNGGYGNGGYGYGSSLYCASDDMRRHYCSADTRGGVQMMRQRSDASCIEGRTWGYDRRGIWVDRGCRADFALNAGGGYNDRGRNGNRGRGGWRPW